MPESRTGVGYALALVSLLSDSPAGLTRAELMDTMGASESQLSKALRIARDWIPDDYDAEVVIVLRKDSDGKMRYRYAKFTG